MAAAAATRYAGPIPVAWDSRGVGEPALLMFGGWCAPRSLLTPLASEAAPRRRVLTLDWRGHGESGKDDANFGEEGLVEDALAVVKESGADRIIPVALAHSGWVAIELARRMGERMPKIVLVDWLVLDRRRPS